MRYRHSHRIIMVRHGQARNNVERLLAGRMEGVELTPEGRRQAEQAAEMIHQIGAATAVADTDIKNDHNNDADSVTDDGNSRGGVSAIYSSPLERADKTARIISERCGGIPISTDERLVEIDMGKFTGMRFADVASEHGNIFAKFYEGDVGIAHQGVETFDQVRRRVLEFVDCIQNDGRITVVVTHLDPIKAVLEQTINVSPERLLEMEIANASLNIFDVMRDGSGSRVSLVAFNVMDAARLAP